MKRPATVALSSIFFLFFFQLLSDFIESIYAFGLLGTSIPPELVSVLVLFTPLTLLFFRKRIPPPLLLILGELILLSRVLEPLLGTRGKMLVSGTGVGVLCAFLPAWIWHIATGARNRI